MAEGTALAEFFSKPPARTYSTGFADLDRCLDGGLREGESTMVGGFTGHAKTAFAEQIALEISVDVETLYLALELGEDLTRLRMGAKLARTSIGAFRRGGLDPMTKAELNSRKLRVFQPKKKSIEMIEALIKRAQHRFIIIDDCRNISGVPIENGKSEAHRIARRITELAEENGVHIMALQQLDSKSFRLGPNEWRFMDSAIFEQRAYNAITLFRPFKHHGPLRDIVSEIRIRKNRSGPSDKFHYRWQGDTMSYWEFSDEEIDSYCTCCKKRKAAEVS